MGFIKTARTSFKAMLDTHTHTRPTHVYRKCGLNATRFNLFAGGTYSKFYSVSLNNFGVCDVLNIETELLV
jgi:hypothetical protein